MPRKTPKPEPEPLSQEVIDRATAMLRARLERQRREEEDEAAALAWQLREMQEYVTRGERNAIIRILKKAIGRRDDAAVKAEMRKLDEDLRNLS